MGAYLTGLAATLGWMVLLNVPAVADEGAVCVTNGAQEPWVFVAENPEGARVTASLMAGQTLCAEPTQAEGKGTVSVFESEDVVEGCSRRVEAGITEVMLAYSEFDRCLWSSNAD